MCRVPVPRMDREAACRALGGRAGVEMLFVGDRELRSRQVHLESDTRLM